MKTLKWSKDSTNNYNGKVGNLTFYVIAFHGENLIWVHPKLPGQKSVMVSSVENGRLTSEELYRQFLKEIS